MRLGVVSYLGWSVACIATPVRAAAGTCHPLTDRVEQLLDAGAITTVVGVEEWSTCEGPSKAQVAPLPATTKADSDLATLKALVTAFNAGPGLDYTVEQRDPGLRIAPVPPPDRWTRGSPPWPVLDLPVSVEPYEHDNLAETLRSVAAATSLHPGVKFRSAMPSDPGAKNTTYLGDVPLDEAVWSLQQSAYGGAYSFALRMGSDSTLGALGKVAQNPGPKVRPSTPPEP